MRAAKEAIEAEAKDKAAKKAADKARRKGKDGADIQAAAGAAAAKAKPEPRTQRNFTDPEAQMMKTTDGFHYAYNA